MKTKQWKMRISHKSDIINFIHFSYMGYILLAIYWQSIVCFSSCCSYICDNVVCPSQVDLDLLCTTTYLASCICQYKYSKPKPKKTFNIKEVKTTGQAIISISTHDGIGRANKFLVPNSKNTVLFRANKK